MIPPCSKSADGRHNFPPGGDCLNGCGLNQAEISGVAKRIVSSNAFEKALARAVQPKKQSRAYTELQDLVGQLIEQFHEPYELVRGGRKVKTFGYYIGRLSRVPISTIYQWRSELRQSRDVRKEAAVFWWKYKEWLKEHPKPKKVKKPNPP